MTQPQRMIAFPLGMYELGVWVGILCINIKLWWG